MPWVFDKEREERREGDKEIKEDERKNRRRRRKEKKWKKKIVIETRIPQEIETKVVNISSSHIQYIYINTR